MAKEKCRYVSTSFWDDEWIQTLDPSEKLLYLYLLTNPLTNIAGVYKITVRRMCFDTGFNADTVGHILGKFEKAGKVFMFSEWIVLPNWPKHQKIGEKDNNRKGVDDILNSLPDDLLQFVIQNKYNYAYLQDLPRCSKEPYKGLISTSNYSNLNLNLNPNSNTNHNHKRKPQAAKVNNQEYSLDFITFYDSYPRKEGKTAANKAFLAKTKQGASLADILSSLAIYKAQIERNHTETQFIKLPATFLNCYEDYKPEPKPAQPPRLRFKKGLVCPYCDTKLPENGSICPKCMASQYAGFEDKEKYYEAVV